LGDVYTRQGLPILVGLRPSGIPTPIAQPPVDLHDSTYSAVAPRLASAPHVRSRPAATNL
ncbi:MAG: hypothetical protein K2N19_01090, partial [Muribaculaceae bacterium]|nr:hypothetical protein [Muribaculaceae bacterium]